MKKISYIYTALFFILIVSLSYTWKGIMEMYRSSYNPVAEVPVMKQYSIMNGKYQFQLPENIKLTKGITSGGEVLYHGDLASTDNKIKGAVEVWNINTTLKDFLDKSRFSTVGVVDVQNYLLSPFQVGELRGYVLTYSRSGNDNLRYQYVEYFIPTTNKEFFRLSFYLKLSDYNENLRKLLDSIALTFKIKS
jgi:hypothetical protein